MEQHSSPESSVTCAGIWGTFGDGMSYIQKISTPRLFLSLGSVLCNDPWPEALAHLKFWADALRPDDLLLIGMDGHTLPNNKEKIWNAYHSCDDLYHKFFLNGFKHANRLAGEEWFREEDWELLAQLEDEPTTRHRFFFRAKKDVKLKKMSRIIQKGEEFDWFDSHKYGEDNVRLMCYKAGLSVIDVWQAPGSEFRKFPPINALWRFLLSFFLSFFPSFFSSLSSFTIFILTCFQDNISFAVRTARTSETTPTVPSQESVTNLSPRLAATITSNS